MQIQDGITANLASNAEYQRAGVHLPAQRQSLGYVSLSSIVNQLEAGDIGMVPGEFAVLREGLGVVAFSSNVAADHTRVVSVLTLFPE